MIVHRPGGALKATGDGIVEGYLISWGGPDDADLEGQWFTPQTELRLEYFPEYPLLYHHGMDQELGLHPIGRIKTLRKDDVGLWVRAQIDMADAYGREVYDMLQQRQFGWSSGSVDHLVKISKSGEIVRWPLYEGSITPTPAQPHKTTVRALKALLPASDILQAYYGSPDPLEALPIGNPQQLETGESIMRRPRIKTINFVRSTLSKQGFDASEEEIESIAAELEDEEATMAGDYEEDATMMDEDDAMMMDEEDAAIEAMLAELEDEDDATMMDEEDAAIEAMLAELEDEDDAMMMGEEEEPLPTASRRRRIKKRRAQKSVGDRYTEFLERRVFELERMEAPGEDMVGRVKSRRSGVEVTRDRADQPGAYVKAFTQYVQGGFPMMNETDQYVLKRGEVDFGAADSVRTSVATKAINISNAGSVGFAVPEDFVRELNRNVMVDALMAADCRQRKTSSDRVVMPDMITTDARRAYAAQAFWPGESPSGQSAHDTNPGAVGQIELPIHVMLLSTTATYSALEDVAFDVSNWISESFAEAVAVEYENLIWRGNGQGKLHGITNDSRVTGAASTSVQSVGGYVATGSTSGFVNGDLFRKILLQLPPGYRKRAKWYMSSDSAAAVSVLKDGEGRYLWGDAQGLNQGIPTTLLNKPIVYNEFADAVSSGLFPIILGDLSRAYTIGKRVEFSVRRFDDATYAVQDQALFLGRARVGGQVTQPAALKVIKVATS
jgi:HK97 family phage major capsid protein